MHTPLKPHEYHETKNIEYRSPIINEIQKIIMRRITGIICKSDNHIRRSIGTVRYKRIVIQNSR